MNSIDIFETYVREKAERPIVADNELFIFGEKFGNGSDSDHFSCGFTTKKLMKNLELINNQDCIYHFDCSYKIIKYRYPLIVFGFTGINRKFFPLAMMFVSHETDADFDHLFKSFESVVAKLELQFDPSS